MTPNEKDMCLFLVHTFRKFIIEFSAESVPVFEASGFVICLETTTAIKTFGNLFSCSNKSFVSVQFFCDGVVDCPYDGVDERNCTCLSKKGPGKHREFDQTSGVWTCNTLYFSSFNTPNLMYMPEMEEPVETIITERSVCTSEKAVLKSQWNDLIPDCGPNAEDEPNLLALLSGAGFFRCFDPNQIPCKPGHPSCYNISDICSFQMDYLLFLKPCRNGGHIQDCQLFECNMKFKCSQSYCIPWSYLCNGRWDCPHGEEEHQQSCKQLLHCVGMFKCKHKTNMCIHLGSICNGFIDCEQGEDESLCELEHMKCPQGCDCLALSIYCDSVNQFSLWQNYPFLAASIYNSPSLKHESFLCSFDKIKVFTLHNSLSHHVSLNSQAVSFPFHCNSTSLLSWKSSVCNTFQTWQKLFLITTKLFQSSCIHSWIWQSWN